MLKLSEADHLLVTAAVTQAERSSDGEIVTIVADKSDSYHDVGLHYAVLAMLLVPAVLAALPQSLINSMMEMFLGWDASLTRGALMMFLFTLLALVFLIVRYALAYMPLRMALTPGSTKTRRVQRRALQLFKVGAERRTVGRTGVLLYLSLHEHRAEIVADEAIVGVTTPETWGEAMGALVAAIGIVGEVLHGHFPRTEGDVNEIPDKLIEL